MRIDSNARPTDTQFPDSEAGQRFEKILGAARKQVSDKTPDPRGAADKEASPSLPDKVLQALREAGGTIAEALKPPYGRTLRDDETVPLQDLEIFMGWWTDGEVTAYSARDKEGNEFTISKEATPDYFAKVDALQKGNDEGFLLRADGALLSAEALASAEILPPDEHTGFIRLTINGEKINVSKDVTPDLYNQLVWKQEGYQSKFYEQNSEVIDTIRDRWDDWNASDSIVSDKDLRKYAADENRSAEDREAAQFLLDNKGFFDLLDTKAHNNKADGKISSNDLNAWLRPVASKAEDIGAYNDFLKASPNADATSLELAKHSALLLENFDEISERTDSGKHLTREALQKYLDENPNISDDLKQALTFWSQAGAFETLETSGKPLESKPDGKLDKRDIQNWLKSASPKTAGDALLFINQIANASGVSGIDTGDLGKDVFENPGNYSAEQRAAVLQDLLKARQLIIDGAAAGLWSDDYGKVSIANAVRSHPDPNKLLADVNSHIDQLQSDPEVVKFLNETTSTQMANLFEAVPGLKDSVQKNYEDIKSGAALDALWDKHTKDGSTDQQAVLAEYFSTATLYQEALGINDRAEIQKGVGASQHAQAFQDYYEHSLASGTRLEELMQTGTFEEAVSTFSAEVALYNAALDPTVTARFDTQLNDNFSRIGRDNAMKDGTFDDLKQALGINGGDELDEAKVKTMAETLIQSNPELVTNPDGTVATADQIVAGIRSNWDILRQGTKSLAELKSSWLNPDLKNLSDKGVLHGVSGIFMAGVTIAKGAQNGANLTERNIIDITTGSVMTTTLLTEGGAKNLKSYLKNIGNADLDPKIKAFFDDPIKSLTSIADKFESGAKGIGGLAGMVAGAYGIFDGVQSIRKGDPVSGGISITSGALASLSGLASAIEGGAGLFGHLAVRAAMAPLAGVLGTVAAGVGAVALLLPGLIAEGKRQTQQDHFGDLLGDYLTQYEIDGVQGGDFSDIPDEDWPQTD
ncbi:type III effector HrpK domain-containing protein [Pseudomonas beijingensis]|uniref:type III effector HrpK domain-containing protein n=1 Tax=Pseudomonas beijingensis TaxID=2954101 RepID=UPI002733C88D|nr:type III effector HrpK domain-containing protein [Pseudomonas sp. FP2262]WLH44485.1 type III effector HrpK domain-containing protein [Pseudomonas sp. FP2262]